MYFIGKIALKRKSRNLFFLPSPPMGERVRVRGK
jgi:hypothetical protein